MACKELSALRIALGRLLDKEAHELAHDREELGELGDRPELLRLMEGRTLPALRLALEEALVHLEAEAQGGDPYTRGLALATEAALERLKALEQEAEALYQDLDLLHHRLHRLFPRR